MRKLILLLLLLAISKYTNCQDPQNPVFYTPQTYAMGKVTFTPVSLYTGQPNIMIPIYTLKYKGIEVPIYLTYNAGGYKPNDPDSWVGMNWTLVAGGMVAQEVQGIVDNGQRNGVASYPSGFIYAYVNNSALNYTNNDLKYFSQKFYDENFNDEGNYDPKFDPAPDIFAFNFLGHTGKFFYGLDRQIHIQSDENFKIDVNLAYYPVGNFSPYSVENKITITSNDGTKYEFGGASEAIEYVCTYPQKYILNNNAYYLTKITTQAGDVVTFNYASDNDLLSDFSNLYLKYFINKGALDPIFTKTVYLRSIICNNQTIEFNTILQTRPVGHTLSKPYEFLDNIKVKDYTTNTEKKTYQFTYDFSNDRVLLKKMQESGQNPYSFYYDGSTFSEMGTVVDLWGYANGHGTKRSYDQVVDGIFPEECPADETNTEFIPNTNEAMAGVLKEITYPTGGTVSYEYEGQRYNKFICSNGLNFVESPGLAGGLRVKKITMSDGSSKSYYYVKNYTPGATNLVGSGILYYKPNAYSFYGIGGIIFQNNCLSDNPPVSYSEVAEVNSDGSYSIKKFYSLEDIKDPAPSYSQPDYNLRQTILLKGTNPNTYKSYYEYYIYEEGLMCITDALAAGFFGGRSSHGAERGRLKEEIIKNKNNQTVKYSNFIYNTDPGRFNQEVTCLTGIKGGKLMTLVTLPGNMGRLDYLMSSFDMYYYPVLLTQKTETVYDINGANPVTTVSKLTYNDDKLLVKSVSTTSNSNKVIVNNYYPKEYINLVSGSDKIIYQNMIDKNMLGSIVKTEKGYDKTSDEVIDVTTEGTKIDYGLKNNSFIVPTTVNKLEGTNYVVKQIFDTYDNYGNLLQMHSSNNINSAYLWGYNNSLPVVKCVNAKSTDIYYTSFEGSDGIIEANSKTGTKIYTNLGYTKVLTGLTNGSYLLTYWKRTSGVWAFVKQTVNVTGNSYSISISSSSTTPIDEVRFYPLSAQMITYTYDLVYGMTSQTDERDVTTYYIYDSYGRLTDLKDDKGNVIKHYEYNYK